MAACGGGGGGSSSGSGGASDTAGVTTDPSGNIARFPDDGSVSYTLNITRQNIESPTSSWNVTATTGGTCSITPPSVTPLTYGTNNQTITSFNIEFTGIATVGGSCVVNFAVNEDEQTRSLRRTVTFNPELAPTLAAELVGSGENIPASIPVRVELTATKRDSSNTPAVTFLDNIVSDGDPSCTATLVGSTTRQYVMNGISTAVATYNVRPTSSPGAVSNCGVFSFNATEGSASGSIGFSDSISFLADTDSDGDGVFNAMDVDDDGDGLIEIRTAAELNMMRYSLDGSGLDADNSDGDNTTGGNILGCPSSGCNGYEQMANIDLNDLAAVYPGPATWEPIGECILSTCSDDDNDAFSAIFDGNHYNISNMRIHVTVAVTGVGFFGVTDIAEIRRVHIRGGSITSAAGVGVRNVGGLVGLMLGGGLTDRTIINSSSVVLEEINAIALNGLSYVGGLVGSAQNGKIITSSMAIVGSINGVDVGGLAARFGGLDSSVTSSAAIVGSVIRGSGVGAATGGLIGFTASSPPMQLDSLYAVVKNVRDVNAGGGLIGEMGADVVALKSSYAVSRNITTNVALFRKGLIGNTFSRNVADSYWDNTTLTPPSIVGDSNQTGEGKSTMDLQTPADTSGVFPLIYTTWANAWCNPDTGDFIRAASSPGAGYEQAWDLGTSTEYPALNCVSNFFSLAEQRAAMALVLDGQSPVGAVIPTGN